MVFWALDPNDFVVFAHMDSMSWSDLHTSETCTRILYILIQTGFTYIEIHHSMGLAHYWDLHIYFLYISSSWLHKILAWHHYFQHQSSIIIQYHVSCFLAWDHHASYLTRLNNLQVFMLLAFQGSTSFKSLCLFDWDQWQHQSSTSLMLWRSQRIIMEGF